MCCKAATYVCINDCNNLYPHLQCMYVMNALMSLHMLRKYYSISTISAVSSSEVEKNVQTEDAVIPPECLDTHDQ